MDLAPEQEAEVRAILRTLDCPQDRPCPTCDFETLGRVEPVGDSGILACREERGRSCSYGLLFGGNIFCQCPLRKYLADHGWK